MLLPHPEPANRFGAIRIHKPTTLLSYKFIGVICRGLVGKLPGVKEKYAQTWSVLEDLTNESHTWRLMGKVNAVRQTCALFFFVTRILPILTCHFKQIMFHKMKIS